MLNLTAQATSHKPQATSHKPLDNIVAQVPVLGTLFHPSTLLILLALVGWHSHAWATDDPVKTPATPVAPDDLFDWSGDLLGQSKLGSNAVAPYAYEGKTWVSVSVGYKFF